MHTTGRQLYTVHTLGRWYMSDDELTWIALPANIKSHKTAVRRAMAYFWGGA